ncbi:MAG: hypothetical protein ACM65L_10735 [Microcoleus sp.]
MSESPAEQTPTNLPIPETTPQTTTQSSISAVDNLKPTFRTPNWHIGGLRG